MMGQRYETLFRRIQICSKSYCQLAIFWEEGRHHGDLVLWESDPVVIHMLTFYQHVFFLKL